MGKSSQRGVTKHKLLYVPMITENYETSDFFPACHFSCRNSIFVDYLGIFHLIAFGID